MIRVVGAGAFGTALAISLSQEHEVSLWTRDDAHAREMRKSRENQRRLADITLPASITIETGSVTQGAIATLLAVPTQQMRSFCTQNLDLLSKGGSLVVCAKGVEQTTGCRPSEIVEDVMGGCQSAVLTGPSFASDIARGLPTALTLACCETGLSKELQSLLSTPNIRLYRTNDVVGAELGGALKNVVAIACGAAIGAGLGESARAALITRGFAEMQRAAEQQGADPDTLTGLSGFGDLVLTCSSEQSRNFRYGLSLGRNDTFEAGTTVEGIATAQAVCDLADKLNLDVPITRAVTQIVNGELQVSDVMDMLLSRPLKEERC